MLESGADFLEDERSVLVLDKLVEEHLCLAERKSSGIVVEGVDGAAYGPQQSELGEMA